MAQADHQEHRAVAFAVEGVDAVGLPDEAGGTRGNAVAIVVVAGHADVGVPDLDLLFTQNLLLSAEPCGADRKHPFDGTLR